MGRYWRLLPQVADIREVNENLQTATLVRKRPIRLICRLKRQLIVASCDYRPIGVPKALSRASNSRFGIAI